MNSLLKQYQTIKAKYRDALVLFRVGDNYETFNEDAITITQELGLMLMETNSGLAIHMVSTFPSSSLESYLHKLVKKGYKVALCEELKDPKLTKQEVKRRVTDFLHP